MREQTPNWGATRVAARLDVADVETLDAARGCFRAVSISGHELGGQRMLLGGALGAGPALYLFVPPVFSSSFRPLSARLGCSRVATVWPLRRSAKSFDHSLAGQLVVHPAPREGFPKRLHLAVVLIQAPVCRISPGRRCWRRRCTPAGHQKLAGPLWNNCTAATRLGIARGRARRATPEASARGHLPGRR